MYRYVTVCNLVLDSRKSQGLTICYVLNCNNNVKHTATEYLSKFHQRVVVVEENFSWKNWIFDDKDES